MQKDLEEIKNEIKKDKRYGLVKSVTERNKCIGDYISEHKKELQLGKRNEPDERFEDNDDSDDDDYKEALKRIRNE